MECIQAVPVYVGNITICDVTCQNQAFVAEINCRVTILLEKNVTLAFI